MGSLLVVVLGWADYYPRFGFVPASRVGISCQWQGVPDNDLMTLEISTGRSMKDVFGTIRYKDEVDATMQTLI